MSLRPTYTGISAAHAECQACTFRTQGKGTLGRAAQHHDRTGHVVTAEQITAVQYGDAPTLEELGQTTLADVGDSPPGGTE